MTNDAPLQQPELVEFPVGLQHTLPPAVPVRAKQYFKEGVAHLQVGEAEEAVAALSRSVEHAPAFPEAHVFLGIAHSLTCNIYPAIDHLEEAAKLAPDSFAAHFTLAQLNFKLRIPKNGYEAARQACKCSNNGRCLLNCSRRSANANGTESPGPRLPDPSALQCFSLRGVHSRVRSSLYWHTCDERSREQHDNHDNALRSNKATTGHVGLCLTCGFYSYLVWRSTHHSSDCRLRAGTRHYRLAVLVSFEKLTAFPRLINRSEGTTRFRET